MSSSEDEDALSESGSEASSVELEAASAPKSSKIFTVGERMQERKLLVTQQSNSSHLWKRTAYEPRGPPEPATFSPSHAGFDRPPASLSDGFAQPPVAAARPMQAPLRNRSEELSRVQRVDDAIRVLLGSPPTQP